MQSPPSKRQLDFGSPGRSPSGSPSTKKTILAGYILDVTAQLKGYYCYIQVQNASNTVVQLPVFNSRIHKTLCNYENAGDRVRLEVFRADDGQMKMGSNSTVLPASPNEVPFALNTSLKEQIKLDKASKPISIKDLKKINARMNTSLFTLKGRVLLGSANPEEVDTKHGLKQIKRDIEIEDLTGKIDLHVFTNRLDEFTSLECYQMTHLSYNDIRGAHMGLTKDSSVTVIDQIKGLPAPPTVKKPTKGKFLIQSFASNANEKIFFNCKRCKKEIPIDDPNQLPEKITCGAFKCNARTRTSALRINGSIEVNFATEINTDENDTEGMWATIFPEVLRKICPTKLTSKEQVVDAVEAVGKCMIIVDNNVIQNIIFNEEDEENKENDNDNEKKGQTADIFFAEMDDGEKKNKEKGGNAVDEMEDGKKKNKEKRRNAVGEMEDGKKKKKDNEGNEV